MIVFILCKISQFLYSASLAWICLFTPLWGVFGRYYPQVNFDIVTTPKRTVLGRKHVVWAINCENLSTGSRAPEKIQYNLVTRKKSQNRNISPIWGEASAEWIEMKICTGIDLEDMIMDVKFKFEKFQGFWCHWGSKFALSHWLCTWALPQCSATALPVIHKHKMHLGISLWPFLVLIV